MKKDRLISLNIFAVVIIFLFSGCASVKVAKDARGTGAKKIYNKTVTEVWIAMQQAIKNTGGKIVKQNTEDCSILAEYPVSFVSWGERVGVFCVQISQGQIETEVVSKRAVSGNITASDWTIAIYQELNKQLDPAPKILHGRVEGDTYYSDEGAFKVQLPHPPTRSKDDEYEWTYTKIQEIKDGIVVGVVFGPAAFDQNKYHAVLIRAPMKTPKEEYVKDVFSKKLESREGIYTQKVFKDIEIKGRQTFYGVYESNNALLVLSLTDNGDTFYAVEADVSKQDKKGSTNKAQIINREWDIFNNMLNSFTVLNPKYKN